MTRLGWLGGSFDPVHEGHLHVARSAADRLQLDEVLFVLSPRPPHKLDLQQAPVAERLAWLRLACAIDPRFFPCELELERAGPSYSVQTARDLHARHGEGLELFLIIGADTLVDLPSWYEIAELGRLVTFVTVAREGTPLDTAPLAAAASEDAARRAAENLLELPPHPASSTAIRAALAAGEQPVGLPPGVEDAIRARGFYGSGGTARG